MLNLAHIKWCKGWGFLVEDKASRKQTWILKPVFDCVTGKSLQGTISCQEHLTGSSKTIVSELIDIIWGQGYMHYKTLFFISISIPLYLVHFHVDELFWSYVYSTWCWTFNVNLDELGTAVGVYLRRWHCRKCLIVFPDTSFMETAMLLSFLTTGDIQFISGFYFWLVLNIYQQVISNLSQVFVFG